MSKAPPHNIWVCTPNDSDIFLGICTSLKKAKLNVEVLSDKTGLATFDDDGSSALMAIRIDNFHHKLNCQTVMDRVQKLIANHEYYSILVLNRRLGTAAWSHGNTKTDGHAYPLSAYKPSTPQAEPVKEAAKPGAINIDLLMKIVKASSVMSDVFFEGTEQADREALFNTLGSLSSPKRTIENVAKAVEERAPEPLVKETTIPRERAYEEVVKELKADNRGRALNDLMTETDSIHKNEKQGQEDSYSYNSFLDRALDPKGRTPGLEWAGKARR